MRPQAALLPSSARRLKARPPETKDKPEVKFAADAANFTDLCGWRPLYLHKFVLFVKVPNIQVPNIQIPNIQVANIQVANIQVANIQVANIQVANIQVASIQVANIQVASIKL